VLDHRAAELSDDATLMILDLPTPGVDDAEGEAASA
jgi:hypothetical protein